MPVTLPRIQRTIQEMMQDWIPTGALRRVKRFMCRGCRKPSDMNIRIFVNHLQRMNHIELPLLPPFGQANCMGDDEITEYIQYAIPSSWNKKLRKQGRDPLTLGLAALCTYSKTRVSCGIPCRTDMYRQLHISNLSEGCDRSAAIQFRISF